jgi:hypothetical protein
MTGADQRLLDLLLAMAENSAREAIKAFPNSLPSEGDEVQTAMCYEDVGPYKVVASVIIQWKGK